MTNVKKLPYAMRAATSAGRETLLADLLKQGDPVKKLFDAVGSKPVDAEAWEPIAKIELAIAENARMLAALPSDRDVMQLSQLVDEALKTITDTNIKKQIAQLIGSFPNANPTDPATYISAILFDILDIGIPDAIVLTTCWEIRRTMRFVPAISEFLAIAKEQTTRWQLIGRLQGRIPEVRKQLDNALGRAQEALIKAKKDIDAGLRDDSGKPTAKGKAAIAEIAAAWKGTRS